jgi:hypothetical protein
MENKKVRSKPANITVHEVLSLNQHHVIDALEENGYEFSDRNKIIKKLNKDVMEMIVTEIREHLFESGAYDEAMQVIADSGMLDKILEE